MESKNQYARIETSEGKFDIPTDIIGWADNKKIYLAIPIDLFLNNRKNDDLSEMKSRISYRLDKVIITNKKWLRIYFDDNTYFTEYKYKLIYK